MRLVCLFIYFLRVEDRLYLKFSSWSKFQCRRTWYVAELCSSVVHAINSVTLEFTDTKEGGMGEGGREHVIIATSMRCSTVAHVYSSIELYSLW